MKDKGSHDSHSLKNKRAIMAVQVTLHEKKTKTWAVLQTPKIKWNAVLGKSPSFMSLDAA